MRIFHADFDCRSFCLVSAALGGVVWLTRVAVVGIEPATMTWGVCLFLLAPLVLVPLALRLIGELSLPAKLAVGLQPIGALSLVVSFVQPAGMTAGLLALPWLLVTGLVAFAGLLRLRRHAWHILPELAIDAGLIYLSIGGVWTIMARLGERPLDFDDVIVFLTAMHFHYAGFVLPLATGLAGRCILGRLGSISAAAVIAGVPLTAIGITASQLQWGQALEVLSAVFLASAGLLVVTQNVRLVWRGDTPRLARLLWALSATALAFGMVLAGLYGLRFIMPLPGLNIPSMRAWHGTANALGFALPVLAAWNADQSSRKRNQS